MAGQGTGKTNRQLPVRADEKTQTKTLNSVERNSSRRRFGFQGFLRPGLSGPVGKALRRRFAERIGQRSSPLSDRTGKGLLFRRRAVSNPGRGQGFLPGPSLLPPGIAMLGGVRI